MQNVLIRRRANTLTVKPLALQIQEPYVFRINDDLVFLMVFVHQSVKHGGLGHWWPPALEGLDTVVQHLVFGDEALCQSTAVKQKKTFIIAGEDTLTYNISHFRR